MNEDLRLKTLVTAAPVQWVAALQGERRGTLTVLISSDVGATGPKRRHWEQATQPQEK